MSKRFGDKRVPGKCKCTYNYTCKACLREAVGWWEKK